VHTTRQIHKPVRQTQTAILRVVNQTADDRKFGVNLAPQN
jgi:hypothetical protein